MIIVSEANKEERKCSIMYMNEKRGQFMIKQKESKGISLVAPKSIQGKMVWIISTSRK